ncbi:hypothetical protein SAMN05421493_12248 [Pseudobutyrivibrio sp. 49]|uniref:hypothetical protein n=1 Tax=Pseudobutyrivibrio sp. 49 TaxID=1855344 RepID=UPI00088AC961|nr:hypothetical protein [Pseudobutyrivibrio sp. 49]SDI68421.1 hypothetical protein SAMN05421493_12248 [Pseudobutyrivibrio sp. 49]
MDLNSLENISIKRVIERGTAKILEQNENCILVYDEVSKALMLDCVNIDEAERVLEANDVENQEAFLLEKPQWMISHLFHQSMT